MYKVTYPSLDGPIQIGKERTIRRVGTLRRLIHVNDVEIGHRSFDKMAIIDADDVATAAAFLTDARREVITTLLSSRRMLNVIVSEASTTFETKKIEDRADRLAGNILGSVRLAELLTKTGSGEGAPGRVLRSFFDEDQFTTSSIQDHAPGRHPR